LIYKYFEIDWNYGRELNSKHSRQNCQVLNEHVCLGITLYKLYHGDFMTSAFLFNSVLLVIISRYIRWEIKILWKVLNSLPKSFIDFPSSQYLMVIREVVGNHYGSYMKNCVFVTNKSIHSLEKNKNAQDNFFYNENYLDYNG
jgi:hypothetical protein